MGTAINQEAVLAAVPAGACLTLDELAAALPALARQTVINTACGLVRRGLLERAERGCYRLTAEGRRVTAEGAPLNCGPQGPHGKPRRPRRSTLRVRLWRAMRLARKFTVSDLLAAACRGGEAAAESNARHYLRQLEAAGYLQRLGRRVPGTAPTSNGFARWSLVRDSGPEAPVAAKARAGWVVRDPNTGQVHPCASETGPADDR